jgi:ribosomal-protein-serine acetyltransferase
MTKKFKNILVGKRIVLKRTRPSVSMAKIMFKTIDENRDHLRPWFSWEKPTTKFEDSLKYLTEKEEKTKAGQRVEYGIYLNKEYMGNIGIFNIDENNKSAEIGYWLSSKFIRNGYTTEAVKIIDQEFFTNFNRIQIKCDEQNKASSGVAKKCGYKFEGKLREDTWSEYFRDFRNILVFSKLKSEFKNNKF